MMGGSLTWIDWHEGTWWAAFGMYFGIPNSGSTVDYVRTVAVASFGQGIVWDRFGEPLLWGIDRKKKRMVVASRVPFQRN